MIANMDRTGRSAYYERPARKGKKAETAKAKADICVNCTEKTATEVVNCLGERNDRAGIEREDC